MLARDEVSFTVEQVVYQDRSKPGEDRGKSSIGSMLGVEGRRITSSLDE